MTGVRLGVRLLLLMCVCGLLRLWLGVGTYHVHRMCVLQPLQHDVTRSLGCVLRVMVGARWRGHVCCAACAEGHVLVLQIWPHPTIQFASQEHSAGQLGTTRACAKQLRICARLCMQEGVGS